MKNARILLNNMYENKDKPLYKTDSFCGFRKKGCLNPNEASWWQGRGSNTDLNFTPLIALWILDRYLMKDKDRF